MPPAPQSEKLCPPSPVNGLPPETVGCDIQSGGSSAGGGDIYSTALPNPPEQSVPSGISQKVEAIGADDHSSTRSIPRVSASDRLKEVLRRSRSRLLRRIEPLHSVETGEVHPQFPATKVNLDVLDGEKLDDLADHYHQRSPGPFSWLYPVTVADRWDGPPDDAPPMEAMDEMWASIMPPFLAMPADEASREQLRRVNSNRDLFAEFIGLKESRCPSQRVAKMLEDCDALLDELRGEEQGQQGAPRLDAMSMNYVDRIDQGSPKEKAAKE